jgi:hypothetical protein
MSAAHHSTTAHLAEELGLIGGGTEGESGAYKREYNLKREKNMKCKEIMTETGLLFTG